MSGIVPDPLPQNVNPTPSTWPYPFGYSYEYNGVPHFVTPGQYPNAIVNGAYMYPYGPNGAWARMEDPFSKAFGVGFDGDNDKAVEAKIIADASAMARHMLRDFPRSYGDEFVARGYPTMFRLSMGRVIEGSFELWIEHGGNVAQATPESLLWTLDAQQGYVRVSASVPKDALLHVIYSAYEWVSDESLKAYGSITYHQYQSSMGTRWPEGFANDARYSDLLAIGTVAEACWALLTEAARDVDVLSPEENIPVSQRFHMLQGMTDTWTGRQRELEAMLDIGVFSLSVNFFRRVSRQTGKLIPIYQDEEWDDPHYPSPDLHLCRAPVRRGARSGLVPQGVDRALRCPQLRLSAQLPRHPGAACPGSVTVGAQP